MANDQLKTALKTAGLTAEQFADVIAVDPKTVQRWVSGRTPYARHRATISRALDIPEHQLWPNGVDAPAPPVEPPAPTQPAALSTDEIAARGAESLLAWADLRYTAGAPHTRDLFGANPRNVDLIDPRGTLMGMGDDLQKLIDDGCQVRIIFGRVPDGEALPEEWARIGAGPTEGIGRDPSVIRADDQIVIFQYLEHDDIPMLYTVHRDTAPTMFARLLQHIDDLWARPGQFDGREMPIKAAIRRNKPESPAGPSSGTTSKREWPRRPA